MTDLMQRLRYLKGIANCPPNDFGIDSGLDRFVDGAFTQFGHHKVGSDTAGVGVPKVGIHPFEKVRQAHRNTVR